MRNSWLKWSLFIAALLSLSADAPSKDQTTADKASLAPLQAYVGGWRGVGQPQRGSSKGAWTEQADWVWHFADGRASIVFQATKGKYFSTGHIAPGDKPGTFTLMAKSAEGKTEVRFDGRVEQGGEIVFTAHKPAADTPARITLRQVAEGARLVMLLEKRTGDRYSRLAEVGYTREGIEFAAGSGKPECIVTGGAGTIQVSYQGKTYYVCCTGCKALFEADPAKVIAKYQE